MDLARCLSVLSTAFNSAEFTCSCSKCPSLEESGRPEPFVHSHAVHNSILNEHGMFTNQPGITGARFVARHRTRLNSGRLADDPGTERLGLALLCKGLCDMLPECAPGCRLSGWPVSSR